MSEIRERLAKFLDIFTDKVPLEYAAVIHLPSGEMARMSIVPGIREEFFKENLQKFINLLSDASEISPEAIGNMDAVVVRGSKGYMILADISPNTIIIGGSSELGSLGLALLKIVELKSLIRERE